jgi:hypothetical protein
MMWLKRLRFLRKERKRVERSRSKMQFSGGSGKRGDITVARMIWGKVTSVLSAFSQPSSPVRLSFC